MMLSVSLLFVAALVFVAGVLSWLRPAKPASSTSQNLLQWLHSAIRALSHSHEMVDEGYSKYTKHGKTFRLPNLLTLPDGPDYVLPPDQLKSYLALPDETLSLREVLDDIFQPDYTFMHSIHKNTYHYRLVTRLGKEMSSKIEGMMDEVGLSMDQLLGSDTESWKDVCVFDVLHKVCARTSSRVNVGLELCRNEDHVSSAINYTQGIFMAAMMIRTLPIWLRRLVGPLIAHPRHAHFREFSKHLRPVIEKRLAAMLTAKPGSSSRNEDDEPDDVLQWHLDHAVTLQDPRELRPEVLASRIVFFNLASIPTPTVAGTHLLFDLYSSPSASSSVDELRDEIEGVLLDEGGAWTLHGLNSMTKLDSAVRESLRLSPFSTRGCSRKVVEAGGITLDNGERIPFGATITIPQSAIHRDEDIYPQAKEYQAFRFVETADKSPQKSIVTTSGEFLTFGHGRHVCPGRFYASAVLKLLLAHLVLHYDVQPLETRPRGNWLGTHHIPPMKATIRVRRRAGR